MKPLFASLAVLCLTGAGMFAGCGDSSTDAVEIDCSKETPKTYTELKDGAFAKCTKCHDSELTSPEERQAAPDDVNYNTYAAAKKNAAEGITQVNEGEMPPSDQTQFTAAEKNDFLVWATCGTPE